nr:helix-turn-helix domain-containing protein [Streptomyces sabulosicollis]
MGNAKEVEEFAERLRALKERSGRSYGSLATRLHVSTSTLHRYCNGDAVPADYAPVERFARLCGATPDELVALHRRWILADAARRRAREADREGAVSAPRPGDGAAPPAADRRKARVAAAGPDPVTGPHPDAGMTTGAAGASGTGPEAGDRSSDVQPRAGADGRRDERPDAATPADASTATALSDAHADTPHASAAADPAAGRPAGDPGPVRSAQGRGAAPRGAAADQNGTPHPDDPPRQRGNATDRADGSRADGDRAQPPGAPTSEAGSPAAGQPRPPRPWSPTADRTSADRTSADRANGSRSSADRANGSRTSADRAYGCWTSADRANGSRTDADRADDTQADGTRTQPPAAPTAEAEPAPAPAPAPAGRTEPAPTAKAEPAPTAQAEPAPTGKTAPPPAKRARLRAVAADTAGSATALRVRRPWALLAGAAAVVVLAVTAVEVRPPGEDTRKDTAAAPPSAATSSSPPAGPTARGHLDRQKTDGDKESGAPRGDGGKDDGGKERRGEGDAAGSSTPGATKGPGHGGSTQVPLTLSTRSHVWENGCGHRYLIDRPPSQVAPPPTEQDAPTWAAAHGAVHGGTTNVEVTVQGRASSAVVLQALHVRVVGRRTPLAWSSFAMDNGCGGSLTPRAFSVNLDAARPLARPTDGNDAGKPIPAVHFPYRVSASDPEVLLVNARTAGCDCSWYLELDWTSGGRSGTLRIDDHGSPFRTSSVKGRPAYAYDYTDGTWRESD